MILSFFVFCDNWHGTSLLFLVVNKIPLTCAVKLYEILKVKNATVKYIY